MDPTQPVDVVSQQPFNPQLQEKGYVMVFTGDGKGKTTAALGLMLRALGRGLNVLLLKFTKGGNHYGSLFGIQQFSAAMASRLTVVQAGLDRIVFTTNQTEEDAKKAVYGWQLTKRAINQSRFDLIILDEINIVLDLDYIPLADVLETLQNKPEHLDIVMTGRRAKPEVIEVAHLVSEVQPVKHYWDIGVKARLGIEF